MFWNKKEERGLPELPPMRVALRPAKEEEVEESAFPELPENEKISSEKMPVESEDELPAKFMPRRKQEIRKEEKEDIYVKIDRFHTARKSLNAAREKLAEIEELMRKIRETRMREEQELASWEKDIDSVKTKVEDVTKNIFEKIE